jgi:uncharacterized phage protein gp47/JayE
MFEVMTYEKIMERMLARVPNNMDKREGSVMWDALAPAAKELEDMYFALSLFHLPFLSGLAYWPCPQMFPAIL